MNSPKKKIAVISDIHANADALAAAVKNIDNQSIDLIVVLGDLLTYGCQPNEVLANLMELQKNNNCIFIKGNHDQFFFDLQCGIEAPSYRVPEFVKESVGWTASQIQGISMSKLFDWHESYRLDSIYFAHANPFQYGDWQYVERAEQYNKTALVLKGEGIKVGVFGHSHRRRLGVHSGNDNVQFLENGPLDLSVNSVYILNPGSVGQPRKEGFSFMLLGVSEESVSVEFVELAVNITKSIELIYRTDMSEQTKEKLVSYLRSSFC
ncbi:metallophosphoesterase family protein [Thermodesulfovibrionales bacterium]|nr:metallophosphoesterase family protein [Thermodesulfovibrionales bacterium]